jgi:CheY-like chemotaxis protein
MSRPVILCVDDEPLILEALKTELRSRFSSRFSYETALDGLEALALIEELVAEGISIVLVVSDWMMPGIKGDEFLSRVHVRWPSIRTILITGHADREALERLLSSEGAPHILPKPWKSQDLLGLVERLCASPGSP